MKDSSGRPERVFTWLLHKRVRHRVFTTGGCREDSDDFFKYFKIFTPDNKCGIVCSGGSFYCALCLEVCEEAHGVRVVTDSDIVCGGAYSLRMRKFLLVVLVSTLFLGASPATADGPPAANVTCSLTDTGVRYGVSMVFTGGGISFNSLKYEWEYLVAGAGKSPTLLSSYGPRTSYTITTGNGLDTTYETLLALAKNDVNASVLMYSSSIFSDGLSTLTNKTGAGCYVELSTVLKNKSERAAAVQKAAADKAAVDLAAAEKSAQDKLKIEPILESLNIKNKALDELIEKYSSMSPSMRANITKISLSRPKIPTVIEPTFTYENALDLEMRMNSFSKNLNTFIQSMLKNTAVTITCVKGKVAKKVTGVSPKCPAGFKKK